MNWYKKAQQPLNTEEMRRVQLQNRQNAIPYAQRANRSRPVQARPTQIQPTQVKPTQAVQPIQEIQPSQETQGQQDFKKGDTIEFTHPMTGDKVSGLFQGMFEEGMNKGKAKVQPGGLGRFFAVPLDQIGVSNTDYTKGEEVNLIGYPASEQPGIVVSKNPDGSYIVSTATGRKMDKLKPSAMARI